MISVLQMSVSASLHFQETKLENAVWPNPDWNKKNIRMKETVRDHKAYTRNPSINITTKYTLVTSSAQDTKLDNHQHRYYLTIEHSAYD
ncbi:uncharacterized protein LOC143036721 isoform X2 [Oratosquilla oratoria]|uniref:uncharacterized protein LOC143036721 isoform X2 n=1 Tax=Oratosquilla oratoria TaxID=337810 RepID=UPI003F76FE94